jgi:triosephosphate isomerase
MKLIIANWKMRVNLAAGKRLAVSIIHFAEDKNLPVRIVLCPAFTEIEEISHLLGRSGVKLGAQDMFWIDSGAYTGEVSPTMLKELGVEFVILGHSERRALGETDKEINQKIKAAIADGLIPIICVGEKLAERKAGKEKSVVSRQLKEALRGIKKINDLIIAYEPVWAIGTGIPEDPDEAVKMHVYIKKILTDLFGVRRAQHINVIYGGSIAAKNAGEFLKKEEIEGALVGGASTRIGEFKNILKIAANL